MGTTCKTSAVYIANKPLQDFLDVVDSIETLGYEDLFIADQALRKNMYAWATLAAARTHKIGIGPSVTNAYTRNPGLSAASMATLDELSDGRAKLGFGAGGHGVDKFGYDQSKLIGTMRDAIDAIRRLTSGETVTSTRDEFSLHEAKLEFKPIRDQIPIYIGGRGPQLLSLAGAVADGAFLGGGLLSPSGVKYAQERISIGANSTGRDPSDIDLRYLVFVSVSQNKEKSLNAAAWFISMLTKRHASLTALKAAGAQDSHIQKIKELGDIDSIPPSELRTSISPELMDLYTIVGNPEDCQTRVEELVDMGIKHLTLVPFSNEEKNILEILETFSDFDCISS